ncbi:MAG: efflux RND transporter permease subunit [Thermoguttaceae bacterium]
MNIAALSIRNRKVTYVLSLLVILIGCYAFTHLGRLEMPDFVIKVAVITTPYPGASPDEVEREVTQVIEESIQTLGQIRELYSLSQEGVSIVYVEMEQHIQSYQLPQIWDELRRKIGDNQYKLPPGAGPSIVNDDFGDVYGLFYAITGTKANGEFYSPEELRKYAKELKKEILLCKDVKKVDFWGTQQEVVYLKMRHAKMAELGVPLLSVLGVLQAQNLVEPSGKVRIDEQYVRITPEGNFTSVEEIGELLFPGRNGEPIRLKDIADVERGYYDPPRNIMKIDGQPSIGFGVSTVAGGNAVTMSQAVSDRIDELRIVCPPGIELKTISNQGQLVTSAVNDFLINLLESLAIVIVLLMIFMGWKSGLLIGIILLQTIFGTFIYMWLCGITMQLISLGALILALGMLVDNAIVVAEGIIIGVQRGKTREEAAINTVRQTQWPLFGATVIAVLAFAAVGFAQGNVGEFCRSLFWVMMSSLLLSWIFAITTTPLLCVDFLKIPALAEGGDPYGHWIFRSYRTFLLKVLKVRFLSLVVVGAVLFVSLWAFGFVPDTFFGNSTRPQFFVDYWRPQGTHIEATSADLDRIEEFLQAQEGVEQISRFVGSGTLRFFLAYDSKDVNPAFGQLLVNVDKPERVLELKPKVERYLHDTFPDSEPQVVRFMNGPPVTYKIEVRFRGHDTAVLHQLSEKAQQIMREEGAWDVSDDWRQPVQVMRPVINDTKARINGITRSDVARAINTNFTGTTVGVYREGEDLLPIILRPPHDLRADYTDLKNIYVVSASLGRVVPLGQIIDEPNKDVYQDSLIRRRHQVKTITTRCNPPGTMLASIMLKKVMPRIENEVTLPPGYHLEWAGEYKASNDGKKPLAQAFPICLGAMFLILIIQFNQFRPPIIIFTCVPLAIIGVTWGLLLSGLPFSFMAILGLLGLSGMLIKNGIILIEQVQINRYETGMPPYQAVVEAAVSRLRPVCMASGTTVLGMLPLMWHPFYASMGATIAGGLVGATALTLIVVPLFYVIFYRLRAK